MLTIEKLREFGANVEEGLARCVNNETFYLKLVNIAIADAGYGKLKDALDAGDLDTAFEAAHALKGMLGNLSLTPISDPVCEVTEMLRSRQEADYGPYIDEIIGQRDKLAALAED